MNGYETLEAMLERAKQANQTEEVLALEAAIELIDCCQIDHSSSDKKDRVHWVYGNTPERTTRFLDITGANDEPAGPICEVDFDESFYIGDEDGGIYFDAADENGRWYMSASVDDNRSHNTDDLVKDDGPYETREAALLAGLGVGAQWCSDNNVRWMRQAQRLRKQFAKKQ